MTYTKNKNGSNRVNLWNLETLLAELLKAADSQAVGKGTDVVRLVKGVIVVERFVGEKTKVALMACPF